ncbi:hypothetical protein PLCT2_00180 [Planctomycetaceae bacterium]|nr:hypothetical protein PLCT2_00180 [Planctomycetaceae bacterium]
MIPTNVEESVFRDFLIAKLCGLKLPGVQLALLIMIAQGRHTELKTVGNSRQSRDQAMAELKAKGYVEIRGQIPHISRAILKEVQDAINSIRSELFAFRLRGPALGRPPAFDWDSLSVVERQYLLAALTEAAALESEARFHSSINEFHNLLSKYPVSDLRARVIGMARLLYRVRNLNENHRKLGLEACIRCAMNPKMSGFARIEDPRTVLADWLANSPLAEPFPQLTFPTAVANTQERNEGGVDASASAELAVEPVGNLATEIVDSTIADAPLAAKELEATSSVGGPACETAIQPEAVKEEAPTLGEQAVQSELAKEVDATRPIEEGSPRPVDEQAPKTPAASTAIENGDPKKDSGSTGVDSTAQPPLTA